MHLQALSRLSTLLMNPGFKESLIAAKDTDEFLDIIDKAENERFGEEEKKTEAAAENVTEDKAVEQKADDGAEKSASAVKCTLPGVSCNCLPYRYCPYVHGSGKSGKYRKEAGDFLEG